MIFRLGELFCGPGGIALGAKWASEKNESIGYSITHAWANDYDKDTCQTYRNHFCKDHPETVVHEDIRKLDIERLAAISDIDALAFGFPCNDFSIVGEQKGTEGTFGPLYQYGINILKRFQPAWFLAENVGGLRNSNDGNALQTILNKMFDAGYHITPHLYKFEKYGVPQARHRIIIVGIKKDLPVKFKVPPPEPFKDIDVSCRKAIEDPKIEPDAENHELTKQSPTVVERLKLIKKGENAFTANLPKGLQLNIKGVKISQIYKRLDPAKPAYTITGSGGGGTHVYHWEKPRALTNRERARLQTFPDDFVFLGSKESQRKQIGMAVPPKGVQVIFDAVLKSFAGVEYPYVEQNISFEIPLFQYKTV